MNKFEEYNYQELMKMAERCTSRREALFLIHQATKYLEKKNGREVH